jgi:hypothetical protein
LPLHELQVRLSCMMFDGCMCQALLGSRVDCEFPVRSLSTPHDWERTATLLRTNKAASKCLDLDKSYLSVRRVLFFTLKHRHTPSRRTPPDTQGNTLVSPSARRSRLPVASRHPLDKGIDNNTVIESPFSRPLFSPRSSPTSSYSNSKSARQTSTVATKSLPLFPKRLRAHPPACQPEPRRISLTPFVSSCHHKTYIPPSLLELLTETPTTHVTSLHTSHTRHVRPIGNHLGRPAHCYK